jgi:hypothetical protein
MSKAAWITSVIVAVALTADFSAGASARSPQADFTLSCENGRTYPIQAHAVTDQGDLVTGYVWTGRGRPAHIRLVPMGAGYRYAARGIWFDGQRQDAILDFGTYKSVACEVVHG